MTTAKLQFTRFVRRANSGTVTNTQFIQAMESVADALKSSPWIESTIGASVLPVNVPTRPDFSGEEFDAYRQSGNAQSATGTQDIFGGMAAYRLRIPAEASETFVRSVSFRAATDKFCVGGLKVAAILSNDPTPPEDWSILRLGGAGGVVDSSGNFATLGPVDAEGNETAGILAESAALVSASKNHAGEFTLDLSSVTTAYQYLYLVVSMFDFAAWRREYWVEGSGLIDGSSIAVTFDADGLEIESADYDVRLPLRAVGTVKNVVFQKACSNLESNYLRMDWGLKMLSGGLANLSDVDPVVVDSNSMHLSPRLYLDGLSVVHRAAVVECYAPEVDLSRRNLWLRIDTTANSDSPIRFCVIDSATLPDVTNPGVWSGNDASCIGAATISSATAGQTVSIPIRRNPATNRLWIFASIAGIDAEATTVAGFPAFRGVSMLDAHISRMLYPVSVYSGDGWRSFASTGTPGGMIFDALRNDLPIHGVDGYAISNDGSGAKSGTSYGRWINFLTDLPSTPTSARLHASVHFILAVDQNGAVLYAGNKAVLDASIDISEETGIREALPIMDGMILLKTSGAAVVKGTAAISSHGSTVGDWSGVSTLRGAPGSVYVVGLKSDGTLVASGFSAGAKSTLEGLTGVADIRFSSSRMIVLKNDGSCLEYTISSGNITTVSNDWTGIISVAATAAAVWGVGASGVVVSAASFPYSAIFDSSKIPAGATPFAVLGSGTMRLAVAYYTD